MTRASTSFRHATTPEGPLRVAFWAVLLAVVTYTRTDPDLWGHVRFGLDVLRDFAVARADPYSFTSDREWINHEWAAEAISAGAFALAGNTGLVLLKVSVVATVLLLLQSVLRREGVDQRLDRDVIAGLAVIGTMEQAHHLRPQLFSLLFFAILLWCLTSLPRRHPHGSFCGRLSRSGARTSGNGSLSTRSIHTF